MIFLEHPMMDIPQIHVQICPPPLLDSQKKETWKPWNMSGHHVGA